ncbi:MAG TPA: acylphosphatase [Candidatus Saccharimonadales bacterium]|nr:acylphosphatase [Candidatus Saccharimonadales bacterium]
MKHLSIKVYGRVQGVWFRQSTAEKAGELGLLGTVENLSDGTVKIEAEGSEEALQELLNWCKEGPEHANVENIDYSEGELKNYKDFSIS